MNLTKLKLNNCFAVSMFVILCICSAGTTSGEIYNADFELFDPNDGCGFDKPTGWNTKNYAASVTLFKPKIESEWGSYENWKIDPQAGLDPFEGDRLVVLSTGQIQSPGSTDHGTISQNIQVYAGQALFGAYFFGTCDYLASFNDFASIRLVADVNSPTLDIGLVHIDVADVGSFGSTDGWQHFEYSFTQEEEGTYDLVCHVEDVPERDNIVNSYLAVDNFNLCMAPEYGDINYDCQTDMKDFGLLAYTWQYDYRDPNNIPDPNSAEYREILYGDLDGNDWVNAADLSLMAGSWLTGE